MRNYLNVTKKKVLVLGIGNSLMSDDGLGIYCVNKMKEKSWPDAVSFWNIGTSFFICLEEICRSHYVIAVDAVKGGHKSGSIYRLTEDDFNCYESCYFNSHDFSLLDIIGLARDITRGSYPSQVIIYGMEPGAEDFGNNLTPEVLKKLPLLINMITTEIKKKLQL